MLHLLWKKIAGPVLLLLLFVGSADAQEHNPLYDRKPYRFGFSLSGINADLKMVTSDAFKRSDTLQRIDIRNFPGLGLGGLVNFRMSKSLDLRFMVNIQLVQRNLDFTFKGGDVATAKMESAYGELPLLLKYKSKRHKNWRFYVTGGMSYRYDFISQIDAERSDTKPVVALQPHTVSYDIGCGLDFYSAYTKISPEIKITNALGSHMHRDVYLYSSSIQRLAPRMIQFSLIFN